MVTEGTMVLTDVEAEVYDRQIRLWGVESQRRLRKADVLLAGLGGLGAEVAKNVLLAGVKSITLLDDATVTEEDTMAHFLVPPGSLGKNRAEASLLRAIALNPMVNVETDTSNLDSKPDEFFSKFDVVIVTGSDLAQLKRINTTCRLGNIKFFCGQVFGMYGYIFADLLIHEYFNEKIIYSGIRNSKKETVTSQETKTYLPLVDALAADLTQLSARRISKLDYSYFLLLALFEFHKAHGRSPSRKDREADIVRLREISNAVLKEQGFPADKIPDSILGKLFGEVSPVCAIIGGVLAQQVIKAVSKKGAPMDEFFFFNPESCCGFVQTFSSP